MTQQIWVNGVATPRLSAQDRGLAYGDGLYETMLVYQGKLRFRDAHMARLAFGLKRLRFHQREALMARLNSQLEALLASLDDSVQVVKLIVSRGTQPRGYRFNEGLEANLILMSFAYHPPLNQQRRQGIRVGLGRYRLSVSPELAGLKHLNRLDQVLASAECQEHTGLDEMLFCNAAGQLVEACSANLFILKDQRLLTPCLDNSGVAGIMRLQVLLLARQWGIIVEEKKLPVEVLAEAEGVFLTNSLIGVMPVRALVRSPTTEIQQFTIDPLIERLQAALAPN